MRNFDNIPKDKHPTFIITEEGTGCSIRSKGGWNYVSLREFPGDCGTLTMHGTNGATKEMLAAVKDIASHCGFDTVIGTMVLYNHTNNTKEVQARKDCFFKAGWKQAVIGKSNRKHTYEYNTKIVYTLHIVS